jgi:hypothetical protein
MRWGAVVVAAAVLASCGSQQWEKSQPPAPWSPARTPHVTTPLASAIPVSVPSGFVLQPASSGANGHVDLTKAARADGTRDARHVLVRNGFVDGYRRQWLKPGQKDENSVSVYRFKTVAGARAYLSYIRPNLLPHSMNPTRFVVTAVPSAFGARGANTTRASAVIAFTSGVYVMKVVASGGPKSKQTAAATALAQTVYFGS